MDMSGRLIILSIICGGLYLQGTSTAEAQGRAGYNSDNVPTREVYNTRSGSNLTVSPYVNLGLNPNGLSNYQTLVRPMIDQREYSRAQTEQLQQPRPAARTARNTREQADDSAENANPRAKARFMHYSHFFGGAR
jgi:hypothetical protein